jgi:hypothetical protein
MIVPSDGKVKAQPTTPWCMAYNLLTVLHIGHGTVFTCDD